MAEVKPKKHTWLKAHLDKHIGKYIALIVIIALIIGGAMRLLNTLQDIVHNILGPASVLFSDLTGGCCKQSTCSNYNTETACGSGCGCVWDKDKCKSSTGYTPGTGGPFTFKCPLFTGILIGGIAFVLLGIGRFVGTYLLRRQANTAEKIANDTAQVTGQSEGDVMRDMVDKSKGAIDDLKGMDNYKKLGDEGKILAEKLVVYKIEAKKATELMNHIKSRWEELLKEAEAAQAEAKAAAKKDGVDADAADDAAEEAVGE